mmetsp:Transcript_31921/g.80973  ORF Transcript_31921/g.80973 Transcript_31921/m.80973 type:complete len:226 (-) Transcript_31921:175-852(-)
MEATLVAAEPLDEVVDVHFNTVLADQANRVEGVCRADAEPQTPTRLDELLAVFAQRHPSIAREIGETAACSLRFEFLQECTRPSGTKDRRREIWHAMGEEDRWDLVQAHSLSDGERDQFFLKIVEQDALMRRKLGLPLVEAPPTGEPEEEDETPPAPPNALELSVPLQAGIPVVLVAAPALYRLCRGGSQRFRSLRLLATRLKHARALVAVALGVLLCRLLERRR